MQRRSNGPRACAHSRACHGEPKGGISWTIWPSWHLISWDHMRPFGSTFNVFSVRIYSIMIYSASEFTTWWSTVTIVHSLISKAGLHLDGYEPICKVGREQIYTWRPTELLPCCHPHDAVFPNKPSGGVEQGWSPNKTTLKCREIQKILWSMDLPQEAGRLILETSPHAYADIAGFPSRLRRFQSPECRRIATCIS